MIVNAQAGRLPLADASVDAALCSPPYWAAQRVYSGAQERDWPAAAYPPMPGLPPVEIPAQCVALGHEADPFAFVAHLLQVFREVRRVLRPHAVLAVNLGDSYSGSRCGPQGANGRPKDWFTRERSETSAPAGLPPKNLLLMPWRFALAMQADGWILRSRMPGGVEVKDGDLGIEPDILWHKRSCMPESVRDRPTVDYEDVLLFSQGPRYFWDQEAGREESETLKGDSGWAKMIRSGQLTRNVSGDGQTGQGHGGARMMGIPAAGRNMRCVWVIKPEPTTEAHYSAWPRELAARLIRVMTSENGVCPECGAPWVREVEREAILERPKSRAGRGGQPSLEASASPQQGGRYVSTKTMAWGASCAHGADPVPATVLDPFAGLGRTWEAARETGRRFVGADLALDYCRMALSRNDLAAMERRRNARKPAEDFGPLFALVDTESTPS